MNQTLSFITNKEYYYIVFEHVCVCVPCAGNAQQVVPADINDAAAESGSFDCQHLVECVHDNTRSP